MSKIKFKLIKLHKKLIFQIEEQDLTWNTKETVKLYNNVRIRSDNTYATVYLNGPDTMEIYLRYRNPRYDRVVDNDNYVTILIYDNNDIRDSSYNKIIESLKEWSENKY